MAFYLEVEKTIEKLVPQYLNSLLVRDKKPNSNCKQHNFLRFKFKTFERQNYEWEVKKKNIKCKYQVIMKNIRNAIKQNRGK